jgi:TfoX/Sxy family transcriptional regulator of competence genes
MTKEHAQKVEHLKTARFLLNKVNRLLVEINTELAEGLKSNGPAKHYNYTAQSMVGMMYIEIESSDEWTYKD